MSQGDKKHPRHGADPANEPADVPVVRIDDAELGDLRDTFVASSGGAGEEDIDAILMDTLENLERPATRRPAAAPPQAPAQPSAPPVTQRPAAPPADRPRPSARPEKARKAPQREATVINNLRNRLARMASETQMYRRRIEGEAEQARLLGHEDVFRALLPALDALDEAILAGGTSRDYDRLYRGLNMVVDRIFQDLRGLGLQVLDPLGQPFDPAQHEALKRVHTGEIAPGTVAQVLRRGYFRDGQLLRPAMVVVEAEKGAADADAEA